MQEKQCFNCKAPETEVPVVNLSYKGKELWICPRCIPNMIHEPQIIESSLASTESDD